jgi:hypothetical protein
VVSLDAADLTEPRTSGFRLTEAQLAKNGIDYQPYLYATGLFDRAWPQFRTPVETHVQAFVDGKIALEQMAATLAATVP